MAQDGLPIPRNPRAIAEEALDQESHVPAEAAAPPERVTAPRRPRAQPSSPSLLWGWFPIIVGVAIVAGIRDVATRAATPASPPSAAATPPPAPASVAPAAQAGHPAEEALRRFYTLLGRQDFAAAHALLSQDVRRNYPRPRFDQDWSGVHSVHLAGSAVDAVADAGSAVHLQACVQIVRPSMQGQESVYSAGPVTMVQEGGSYRVGPSALRRVSACS
ncbi:MAG: hypothetical protein ACRDI2_16830 [Chloroflexota bacterium]